MNTNAEIKALRYLIGRTPFNAEAGAAVDVLEPLNDGHWINAAKGSDGDKGSIHRATMSTGETTDPVHLGRRGLKCKQGKLSCAKGASNTRRKKFKSVQAECERNRIHRISAPIDKRHGLIAVEHLRTGNMMKNNCIDGLIAEQQWGPFAHQLNYTAEGAGCGVVRVAPHHTSMDCSVRGSGQAMQLCVREYACKGFGPVLGRDFNAARNILRRGGALAGWEIGSTSHPGVSESVMRSDAAGLPEQDTERHAADNGRSCI